MKNLKIASKFAVLALCVIAGACVGFPKGQALQFIVQSTAVLGTVETIKHEPKTKPKFELTVKSLDALIASGKNDPVALQSALTNLPISEFKGPEGQILVAEGAIVINLLAHGVLQIDAKTNAVNNYVAPVSHGLRDGIKQGIALSP